MYRGVAPAADEIASLTADCLSNACDRSENLERMSDELMTASATFCRSARPQSMSMSNPLSRMVGGAVNGLARAFGGTAYPPAPPPPTPPCQSTTPPEPPTAVKPPLWKPPLADEPWLMAIKSGFHSGGLEGALRAFDGTAEGLTLQREGKPSTYIRACEVLHHCGAPPAACANLLFNVLEARLADFQTCRVVAYHLLSLERFDDAVALLELVRTELAPAEPHSHTDIALARLLRLRRADVATVTVEHAREEMAAVVSALLRVITSTEWPERFREIEWPALIALSWAVAWAEHTFPCLRGSLWPEAALAADTYRVGGEGGPQLDVFIWLGWDTDHTDVDLHVKEPTGEEVCYSHNRSETTGARVSRDFTQGFGPEVYTLPKAPKGSYKVETNYYASHQASASTGATSAVIWSVQHMGRFEHEVLQFSSVRLTSHKQRQQVLELSVQ